MFKINNLQSTELFAELTDEQLASVVGGIVDVGPLVNGPLVDNRNGNIQGQGIGGQLSQSPVGLGLSALNNPLGLIGL